MIPNDKPVTPIALEPAPAPVNAPKFICGSALDPKQSAELLKILRTNKFFILPDNKPSTDAVYVQIQADVNNGGFITVGYNSLSAVY